MRVLEGQSGRTVAKALGHLGAHGQQAPGTSEHVRLQETLFEVFARYSFVEDEWNELERNGLGRNPSKTEDAAFDDAIAEIYARLAHRRTSASSPRSTLEHSRRRRASSHAASPPTSPNHGHAPDRIRRLRAGDRHHRDGPRGGGLDHGPGAEDDRFRRSEAPFGSSVAPSGTSLRFVTGTIVDLLQLVGSVLTACLVLPMALANLGLLRLTAAKHYGAAVEDEVLTSLACAYRIAIGHPIRFLGLGELTDGLERRLPELLGRRAHATGATGEQRRAGQPPAPWQAEERPAHVQRIRPRRGTARRWIRSPALRRFAPVQQDRGMGDEGTEPSRRS